jgi:hypothetical protein
MDEAMWAAADSIGALTEIEPVAGRAPAGRTVVRVLRDADRIVIDGVVYFNGHTKTVRASVGLLMNEMMSATWKHQSIIDGKPEDFYRRSRGQGVAANGGVISHILRA